MRVKCCCSSSSCTAATPTKTPPYRQPFSADADTDSFASKSSLRSDLSLQTLPSLPSLQLQDLSITLASQPHVTALPPPHHRLPVTCLALQAGLLYAASAHEITVYDLVHRPSIHRIDEFNARERSSGSIKAVAFCDGKVFTAHQDCKIRVWRMTSEKRHRFVTALPTVSDRLCRFPLPKNYVTVRRHRRRLWIEHADTVSGLAVRNGVLYSVSWDRSLKIWQASNLRCLESVIAAHDDAINAVVVSGDGTVYTGSTDRRIRVWAKPERGNCHVLVATLEKHKSAVNALALNDDGSVLFSGSCDRSILVWEREESACHMAVIGALRGHRKAVLCLFNVSDLLLSGSADRTVRIWRRGEGGRYACLTVLEGHARAVKSVVAETEFYGESNGVVTVFSGGLDGETKVWEVSGTGYSWPVCPRTRSVGQN